jgi:hypothetical protein
LNGSYQLLPYADDVNILEYNTGTLNKNTETIIDAIKEFVLEVKLEKSMQIFVSRDENAELNWDLKIANKSF